MFIKPTICYWLIMASSCGEVFNVTSESPPAGELATVHVDDTGRADFRLVSLKLKVSDLIGRSISFSNSNDG